MNSSVSHPYLRLWLVESTTVCTLAYCYSSSLIYKCDGAHMVRLPCIHHACQDMQYGNIRVTICLELPLSMGCNTTVWCKAG